MRLVSTALPFVGLATLLSFLGCGSSTSGGSPDVADEPDTGDETGALDVAPDPDLAEADETPSGPDRFDLLVGFARPEGGCCSDPIEGAFIAIDGPAGRVELTTDANGMAEIQVARGESIDITVAKAGFPVFTWTDLTHEELSRLQAEYGEVRIALAASEPSEEPELTALTVTAEGVGTGQEWCLGYGDFLAACSDSDLTAELDIVRNQPWRLTAALWEGEQMVDFEVVEVLATQDTASQVIEFDGDPAVPIEVLELSIETPPSPDSPLRLSFFDNEVLALAYEPGIHRYLGHSQRIERGPDREVTQVGLEYGDPTEAEPIFRVFVWSPDGRYRSSRSFGEAPTSAGRYDILDVPILISPAEEDPFEGEIAWRPVPRAQAYRWWLQRADTGDLLWWGYTKSGDSFDLPALPSGYDPSGDWPAPGSEAYFTIDAGYDPDADRIDTLDDPARRDAYSSSGQWFRVTLAWPGH